MGRLIVEYVFDFWEVLHMLVFFFRYLFIYPFKMKLNIEIIINSLKETIFKNSYVLNLREVFIKNNESKSSGLENNVNWFLRKLKLNNSHETDSITVKWSVYYVDFGINIGTEINGIRPALIYKATKFSYGRDIIVIPFTSFREDKSVDKFDITIQKELIDGLKNDSILKTRHIKSISKKRLGKFV